MKREEEEINQASGAYAFQLCAECINNEICKEMGLGCPRLRESIIAFSEGAKWSDEHPKNVWHPADEQPVGRDWKILIEDKSGCYWVEGKCSVYSFYDSWQNYVENFELTRWAYISDLLPKGGKK